MFSTGSSALPMTCRHSTPVALIPLARATATKGWAATWSMLRSSICASGAEIGTATAIIGRISPCSGLGLITGIQRSWKENS